MRVSATSASAASAPWQHRGKVAGAPRKASQWPRPVTDQRATPINKAGRPRLQLRAARSAVGAFHEGRRRSRCHEVKLRVMRPARALLPDLTAATPKDVVALAESHGVRFLRLQFSEAFSGSTRTSRSLRRYVLRKALASDILFDGSSIERLCAPAVESDMLLRPDLTTFRVFPWGDPEQRVGRLICDIVLPDGTPFPGDPRGDAAPPVIACRRTWLRDADRRGGRVLSLQARCRRASIDRYARCWSKYSTLTLG